MELAIRITLVLHLLGFASLMTGTLGQIKSFKNGEVVLPSILHGAWLSLITGLAMAGLLPANGEQVNALTISLKSAGITAIFFIAYTYSKKANTPKWVVPSILALTILNLIFAVVIGAAA
jgi:hypothetical protein